MEKRGLYWVGGEEHKVRIEDSGPDDGCKLGWLASVLSYLRGEKAPTIHIPACAMTAVPGNVVRVFAAGFELG